MANTNALKNLARRKAQKYGLDPDIFVAQINQESGFSPDVVYGRRSSSAGAQGIAQIMPDTAKGWGVNPLKPKQALDAAARNMASYVKQFGSYDAALRAYNAGPGNVKASHGFSETNNYVKTILGGKSPSTKGVGSSAGQTSVSGVTGLNFGKD
jgi:soluble lytic murein transglycosylase-like protein